MYCPVVVERFLPNKDLFIAVVTTTKRKLENTTMPSPSTTSYQHEHVPLVPLSSLPLPRRHRASVKTVTGLALLLVGVVLILWPASTGTTQYDKNLIQFWGKSKTKKTKAPSKPKFSKKVKVHHTKQPKAPETKPAIPFNWTKCVGSPDPDCWTKENARIKALTEPNATFPPTLPPVESPTISPQSFDWKKCIGSSDPACWAKEAIRVKTYTTPPTSAPSVQPTSFPSSLPSFRPTPSPSIHPTHSPTSGKQYNAYHDPIIAILSFCFYSHNWFTKFQQHQPSIPQVSLPLVSNTVPCHNSIITMLHLFLFAFILTIGSQNPNRSDLISHEYPN
jgi:hypothetical protein